MSPVWEEVILIWPFKVNKMANFKTKIQSKQWNITLQKHKRSNQLLIKVNNLKKMFKQGKKLEHLVINICP